MVKRDERMRHAHLGEEHRDQQHDRADHQPAQHRAGDVAAEDHPVRHRADQQLLDVAAELGAEEARGDVAVAVLDHAHHHQARDDEVHVADAVHRADARADQAAEDQEVQRHRDRRRHQGLAPDAQDARDLAARRWCPARRVARAASGSAIAHAALVRLLVLTRRVASPVRRTNSSSRRLRLGAHRAHADAGVAQRGEHAVEVHRARHVEIERVVVGGDQRGALDRRQRRRQLAVDVEHEAFDVELGQQRLHRPLLDDACRGR